MDKKVWRVWLDGRFQNPDNMFMDWDFSIEYNLSENKNFYNFYYMEIFDWEFSETKCIYEINNCILEKDDVVLDLGSNVGMFTKYAAEKCKKVISVEGSPEYFSCLVENTTENKNVSYLNANIVGKTTQSIDTWGGKPTVINVTLENIFELYNLDRINFLKIDIEGGEYSIFDNIDPTLLNRIDKIAIETHDDVKNFELALKIGKKLFTFDWYHGETKQTMFYFT